MNLSKLLLCGALTALMALASCSTPKNVTYFQDTVDKELVSIAKQENIRLRPEDKILILVNSRDASNVNMLNLPFISRNVGTPGNAGNYQGLAGYTIDPKGYINFPVLGKIHAAGMTRDELAQTIQDMLAQKDIVKDAIVTVEFENLSVSVLGEVNSPGKYPIDKDNLNILEALAAAGDLTINGKRDNIRVTRREGDKQHTYVVDLTSAEKTYGSPAFYLQQNDVVYVEPNSARIRESTVNGNNLVSASFWLSLTSVLATIGVLIFK